MTCPDCERHKTSASMWRNKAYELGGTPLPWDAEELIQKAVLAEREACAKVVDRMADYMEQEMEPSGVVEWVRNHAKAIRARSNT